MGRFLFTGKDIIDTFGINIRTIFYDRQNKIHSDILGYLYETRGMDFINSLGYTGKDWRQCGPAYVYIGRIEDESSQFIRKFGVTKNSPLKRIRALCTLDYRHKVLLEAANLFNTRGEALLVEQYFKYVTRDNRSKNYPTWLKCGVTEHMVGYPRRIPKSWVKQAESFNRTEYLENFYLVNGCLIKFKPTEIKNSGGRLIATKAIFDSCVDMATSWDNLRDLMELNNMKIGPCNRGEGVRVLHNGEFYTIFDFGYSYLDLIRKLNGALPGHQHNSFLVSRVLGRPPTPEELKGWLYEEEVSLG